ncbi:MAG: Eukaryotic-type low-affinity urea transporter, partial [uncultured Solirubrobacteraceae bacterium]
GYLVGSLAPRPLADRRDHARVVEARRAVASRRVRRLLPARRRAGLLHEQPDHRSRHPGGDVRRRAVARLRGRPGPGGLDRQRGGDRDGPRGDQGRPVRLQRRSGRRGALALPPARLGCAGDGLDRDGRLLLDHPARRAGQRLPRRLGGSAVHPRLQLHHADLPHRRAELRQRPRRPADRPRGRPGHGRRGQHHAALGGRCRGVEQRRRRDQRDLPRHQPAVLRQQRGVGNHHRPRHRRLLPDRGRLRAGRLRGRSAHRARARRQRRRHLQRPLGLQLLRRGARHRRRVLRPDLAVGASGRRLRRARGPHVRRLRLALHAVGAAGADAAVLLRDAGLRALEGREQPALRRRGGGHHHSRGAPAAPLGPGIGGRGAGFRPRVPRVRAATRPAGGCAAL